MGVLNKWKAAWNDGNASKTIELFHPKSTMAKRLAKDGMKENYIKNTAEFKEQLGNIVEISVGNYIEKSKVYIMRVKYDKKGLFPGTFSIMKDEKEEWMIKSLYIMGNGEPELADVK